MIAFRGCPIDERSDCERAWLTRADHDGCIRSRAQLAILALISFHAGKDVGTISNMSAITGPMLAMSTSQVVKVL